MTINRNSLLHYSLLGKDDALTQDEVRKVVHLYLEEHYDGNQQFVKWPKDIKDICASYGITQSKETGFPVQLQSATIGQAWSERCKLAEHRVQMLNCEVEDLYKEIARLELKVPDVA